MKKPNFIELRIPGRKGTISPAGKRYFKKLEGKTLQVNFGEQKQRKLFEYVVKESSYREGWKYWGQEEKPSWSIKLELKVPKEDPNKVL